MDYDLIVSIVGWLFLGAAFCYFIGTLIKIRIDQLAVNKERNEQLHLISEKLEEINNSFMFLNLRGHKSNKGEE